MPTKTDFRKCVIYGALAGSVAAQGLLYYHHEANKSVPTYVSVVNWLPVEKRHEHHEDLPEQDHRSDLPTRARYAQHATMTSWSSGFTG